MIGEIVDLAAVACCFFAIIGLCLGMREVGGELLGLGLVLVAVALGRRVMGMLQE